LSKVQSETQSLGINSTPTFVVEGPGGKKVVGSGVLPLSQIESAIKSVE
jgi:protein-disulfide isomerase